MQLIQNIVQNLTSMGRTVPSSAKVLSIPLAFCALICACSNEISNNYTSFKDMCEASGGTYMGGYSCKCPKEPDDPQKPTCTDGVICIEGKCAAECRSGETRCSMENGKAIFKICVLGEWNNRECDTNQCHDDKTCESLKCTSDDNKCLGSTLLKCESNILQVSLCSDNALCITDKECGVCREGMTKCTDNNILSRCTDNQWHQENCDYGCSKDGTACNDATADDKCPKDATKCDPDDDKKLLRCVNGKWIPENCDYGCSKDGTACNDATADNVCTEAENGNTKCSKDGTSIIKCEENQWKTIQNCTNSCVDGDSNNTQAYCKCEGDYPKCKDNYLIKCDSEKEQSKSCSDDNKVCDLKTGECESASPCNADEDNNKCEDNIAYVCTDNGWSSITECGDFGCSETLKTCNECKDDDVQCKDDHSYRFCNEGVWEEKPCEDNEVCKEGKCVPDSQPEECKPGVFSCKDNGYYVCESEEYIPLAYCVEPNNNWNSGTCNENNVSNECQCDTICYYDSQKQIIHLSCNKDKRFCVKNTYDNTATEFNTIKGQASAKLVDCNDINFNINDKCDSSGAPKCIDGETKCEDNILKTCNKEKWDTETDCGTPGCDSSSTPNKCIDPVSTCEDRFICKNDTNKNISGYYSCDKDLLITYCIEINQGDLQIGKCSPNIPSGNCACDAVCIEEGTYKHLSCRDDGQFCIAKDKLTAQQSKQLISLCNEYIFGCAEFQQALHINNLTKCEQ